MTPSYDLDNIEKNIIPNFFMLLFAFTLLQSQFSESKNFKVGLELKEYESESGRKQSFSYDVS